MEHPTVPKREAGTLPALGSALRIAGCALATILFANLNALVDAFLHPEIPYFDHEHVVVGLVTGTAVAVLFVLQWLHARRLQRSLERIAALESFLPICSYCKKVRFASPDGTMRDSWQPVEFYFFRHTTTRLSHGICPACLASHHPEALSQDPAPSAEPPDSVQTKSGPA